MLTFESLSLRVFGGLHPRWFTDWARRLTTLNQFVTGPTRWVLPKMNETVALGVRQHCSPFRSYLTVDFRLLPHHPVDDLQPRMNMLEFLCLFQNNIPMFSPALTDGALGDMFYLFSNDSPGLVLDVIEGKGAFIVNDLLDLSLKCWVSHTKKIAFNFRCFKAEQHGGGCQQHGDDHPGRGRSQASHL